MLCSLVTTLIPWVCQLIVVAYFLVLTAFIASYEGSADYAVGTNSSNSSTENTDAGDSCTPTISYDNFTYDGTAYSVATVSELLILH